MEVHTELAQLLRQRNSIDERITQIINRPASTGHLGEFVAAKIFDIELEVSAVTKAIDGKFRSGPLAGKTVNIKCYGRQESLLDIAVDGGVDYYLVLTGPKGAAVSSRGTTRPWCIHFVYLFHHTELVDALVGRKLGVATSVRGELWHAAEVFPEARNPVLLLGEAQKEMLWLFG